MAQTYRGCSALAFGRRHAVLLIAALAAAATMAAVPPDGAYLSYIDCDTLGCLFSVLAVLAGTCRLCGL